MRAMGFARTARFALAIVVAGVAAATVDADGARSQRGVHVVRIEQISNDLDSFDPWVSSTVRFSPDGSVLAAFGHVNPPPATPETTSWRRVNADGTKSDLVTTPGRLVTCWSPDGVLFRVHGSNLIRVDANGTASSAPLAAGGDVGWIAAHDASVCVLTMRLAGHDSSLWWQRFAADGTPQSLAVRVSPAADAPPTDLEWHMVDLTWADIDAAGSTFVIWSSYTLRDGELWDRRVQWRRIDADGSMSSLLTVIDGLREGRDASVYDGYSVVCLAGNGTTWVLPLPTFAPAGSPGMIGVRRDGVVLPRRELLPGSSAAEAGDPMALAGDSAGGLRIVLPIDVPRRSRRDGRVRWERHMVWSEFDPDAAPLRSRRLGGTGSPYRRSHIFVTQSGPLVVAPDGTSLLLVTRDLVDGRRTVEFVHLDARSRRLSHGTIQSAFLFGLSNVAVTQVDGRTRFSVAWTARETTEGPSQTFVSILE
jgi:hypothetical protein